MENKKYLSFELDETNYKIHNILNQDFLEIEMMMIADHDPNNNNSHFTLESMQDAIPTFFNKPILASFNKMDGEEEGDTGGHDSTLEYDEKSDSAYFDNSNPHQEVPLGLITESSKVEIIKGEDGNNWIKANGFLWVQYAVKPILSLLRKRKGHSKISVEVEVLDSETDEETGIEHIKKFKLLGVTILGSYPVKNAALLGLTGDAARQEIHEGIEGANLKVLNFSKNPEFQKRLQKLTMAYEQFEKSMNFKIENESNQNETKSEKVSEAVEGQDIYHPHPQNPENEEVPVIGYEDNDNKDKQTESETEKETLSRKEKQFSMLTYNVKRQLLESALAEAVAGFYGNDNRIYSWVQDFSDAEVYFYLDGIEEEGTYCAPYTLTMSATEEDKVENCVIDLASKEKAVQTWKKYSDEEDGKGTEKTDMQKNEFGNDVVQNPEADGVKVVMDDRNTEAPKSGDDRAVPESKSGDDRGTPKTGTHENHSEEDKKEDKGDKQTEAENCPDCGEKKENCKCSKQTEACGDKETEAKDVTEVKSQPAGGDKEVTGVSSKSVNSEDEDGKGDKCDCSEDKKEDNCNMSKENKEDNCNYQAKFEQLSADYAVMQKENEALKSMNIKFQSEITELSAKIEAFQAEKVDAQNTTLYNFAVNMINAETDLSEDTRKAMSAEVEAECKASKFSTEDEVKKFTITKIAMALYENRQAQKEVASKSEGKKEEFVQAIVKNDNTKVDALTQKRQALESI